MRFCFQPGDQVIKLDRPKVKVLPKCSGPYQFERYLGKRCLTPEISTTNGTRLQLSATHLYSMLSQLSLWMLRWPEHVKEPGSPPSYTSEDPMLSTSLDDDDDDEEEPHAVWKQGEEPHAMR